VVAFSKKLRWLAQTKVITLKTQLHAGNARCRTSAFPKLGVREKSRGVREIQVMYAVLKGIFF